MMHRRVVLATLLALGWTYSIHAGVLRLGEAALDGQLLTVPVILDDDSDGRVAGLDFSLNYDPAILEPLNVVAGPAATEAGKYVTASVAAPGRFVMVLHGVNQTTVDAGQILRIEMRVLQLPEEGQTQLAIASTTFTTPEAEKLPSTGSELEVTLGQPEEGNGAAFSGDGASSAGLPEAYRPESSPEELETAQPGEVGVVAIPGETMSSFDGEADPDAVGQAELVERLSAAVAEADRVRARIRTPSEWPAGARSGVASAEGGSEAEGAERAPGPRVRPRQAVAEGPAAVDAAGEVTRPSREVVDDPEAPTTAQLEGRPPMPRSANPARRGRLMVKSLVLAAVVGVLAALFYLRRRFVP